MSYRNLGTGHVWLLSIHGTGSILKPGFHSNAIACVACVAYTKTARNASACVGKQPITVATASTEHLAGACVCCVKFHATNASASQ